MEVNLDVISLDSTTVKVHLHGTGVLKNGPHSISRSRSWSTINIQMVASSERTPVIFSLSGGQVHDDPEGCKLLERLGPQYGSPSMVIDRAYEGDATH